MALGQYYRHPGRKVICTITAAKGECLAGHKVGDTFEVDARNTGGLCGAFYHMAYPYIRILEHGGTLYGDNVIELDCPDKVNARTMEIRPKE